MALLVKIHEKCEEEAAMRLRKAWEKHDRVANVFDKDDQEVNAALAVLETALLLPLR